VTGDKNGKAGISNIQHRTSNIELNNEDAKTRRGGAATKNNFIRNPGNQEFFPRVLGFLASS
jgi:hypothetical protein